MRWQDETCTDVGRWVSRMAHNCPLTMLCTLLEVQLTPKSASRGVPALRYDASAAFGSCVTSPHHCGCRAPAIVSRVCLHCDWGRHKPDTIATRVVNGVPCLLPTHRKHLRWRCCTASS